MNPFLKPIPTRSFTKISKVISEKGDDSSYQSLSILSENTRDISSFIKLFSLKELIPLIESLSKVELRILFYIFLKLRYNSDIITINFRDIKESFDISDSSIYRTVTKFESLNFIKHIKGENYYINLNLFFKGNRIAFIKKKYGT